MTRNSDTSDSATERVWVGLTAIPSTGVAQMEAFRTEEQAKAYREEADEKAQGVPVDVFINIAEVSVTEPEDDERVNSDE